jgi:hypothetical protein
VTKRRVVNSDLDGEPRSNVLQIGRVARSDPTGADGRVAGCAAELGRGRIQAEGQSSARVAVLSARGAGEPVARRPKRSATSGVTGQFKGGEVDDGGRGITLFMRAFRPISERLAWLSGAVSNVCCPTAAHRAPLETWINPQIVTPDNPRGPSRPTIERGFRCVLNESCRPRRICYRLVTHLLVSSQRGRISSASADSSSDRRAAAVRRRLAHAPLLQDLHRSGA